MGFRAHLHQRSLALVWNDFWRLWWPMIYGDGWDLSFPDISLTVDEKPQKKPQPGKLTLTGLEPGLVDRQRCYPLSTVVVIKSLAHIIPKLGAKGDWDFRISELIKKTLMELIFNPCGEFRWSPEGPVSQIHSPHLHGWCPWDLFRSFKVCSDAKEREWGAESNGKLPKLFIPSKTAALVPELAVKDLLLGRTLWRWWFSSCILCNIYCLNGF